MLSVETEPGVWTNEIVEKFHKGEVIRNSRRWEPNEEVSDNLQITNRIEIVANSFVTTNMHNMVYIELNGGKWKITKVDIARPRIEISLGGVYNG